MPNYEMIELCGWTIIGLTIGFVVYFIYYGWWYRGKKIREMEEIREYGFVEGKEKLGGRKKRPKCQRPSPPNPMKPI